MKGWEAWPVLKSLFQQRVTKVKVITFEFAHKFTLEMGDLEVYLENNRMLRFTSDKGGDLLTIATDPWIDPFQEPLSDSDKEAISQYGKFTSIDVSTIAPYETPIGARITAIYPLISQFNLFAGVRLRIGSQWLNFVTQADETFILWGKASKKLEQLGFRLFEE